MNHRTLLVTTALLASLVSPALAQVDIAPVEPVRLQEHAKLGTSTRSSDAAGAVQALEPCSWSGHIRQVSRVERDEAVLVLHSLSQSTAADQWARYRAPRRGLT